MKLFSAITVAGAALAMGSLVTPAQAHRATQAEVEHQEMLCSLGIGDQTRLAQLCPHIRNYH